MEPIRNSTERYAMRTRVTGACMDARESVPSASAGAQALHVTSVSLRPQGAVLTLEADMEELDPKVSAAAYARQQRVLRRGMYLSGRSDSF